MNIAEQIESIIDELTDIDAGGMARHYIELAVENLRVAVSEVEDDEPEVEK